MAIVRFLRRLAAERSARRAIRELEAMDDLELRDLAICRDDIRRVVLVGRGNVGNDGIAGSRLPPRLQDRKARPCSRCQEVPQTGVPIKTCGRSARTRRRELPILAT
jgi:uncharacterized protein YjiS (DUF1127 family)